MRGVVGFLGALTARLIGLALLIPPATLVTKLAAGGVAGVATVIDPLRAAVITVPCLLLAFVFLSPRGTRWLLRRRADLGLQIILLVLLLVLLAIGLGISFWHLPLLDPSSAAWSAHLKPVYIGLWVAFFLLFVLPGSYARQLAVRHRPADEIVFASREFEGRSFSEAFIDWTGALTARVLGLAALAHPVLYAVRIAQGSAGIDPLALAGGAFNLSVAAVLLIPSATRSAFMPASSGFGRFIFALTALMAVIAAVSITLISVYVATPEEARETLITSLALTLQMPVVLFVAMFLMPGYYSNRLPVRTQLRELSRLEAQMARQAAAADHVPESADWQRQQQDFDAERDRVAAEVSNARPSGEPRSFVLTAISAIAGTTIVGFMILAFYGWREAQFVPTAELAALAPELHLPMIILMGIVGMLGAITADSSSSGMIRSLWVRLLVLAPGMAAIAALGSQQFLTKGLPGAHSFLVDAPESEISVEVAALGKRHVRRGCDYTAFVRGTDYAGPSGVMICEVDPQIWQGLRTGDRIVLHGYKTAYGFRYDRVTR